MAIISITTTDATSERWSDFQRFVRSLVRNHATYPDIRSYVLVQNATEERLAAYAAAAPAFCRLTSVEGRMSLSAARNRLMSEVSADGAPGAEDVVAFFDDDCWLPDAFLASLAATFHSRPSLDLLICLVSLQPDTRAFGSGDIVQANARHIVRMSSSNNMFVRGLLFAKVGPFDTALGVGTPIGSAEDTDYAIRSSFIARQTAFVDRALVGHRAPDTASTARYYRGSLLVLTRYALRAPSIALEFVRKILVGFYLIACGRLSVGVFFEAFEVWRRRSGAGTINM